MAGPQEEETNTLLIGQGFRPIDANLNYDAKWGVIKTQTLPRKDVKDYFWEQHAFEEIIAGNEEIKAYLYEAASYPRVDTVMNEITTYSQIYRTSTRMLSSTKQWNVGDGGGPWYVEVGRDIEIS